MRNKKGQFIKGNTSWLKGTKGLIRAWNKGKKIGKISNKNHYGWKGDKVSVKGIHMWLKTKFPRPKKCQQCGKMGEKINGRWTIEWSLLKGKKYERKRENFIRLCRSCHMKYDYKDTRKAVVSEETKRKISETLKKRDKHGGLRGAEKHRQLCRYLRSPRVRRIYL